MNNVSWNNILNRYYIKTFFSKYNKNIDVVVLKQNSTISKKCYKVYLDMVVHYTGINI